VLSGRIEKAFQGEGFPISNSTFTALRVAVNHESYWCVAGFLRSIHRASARFTKKGLSKYYNHFQGLVNRVGRCQGLCGRGLGWASRYYQASCHYLLAERRWSICNASCHSHKRPEHRYTQCRNVPYAGIWPNTYRHALA